MPQGQTNIETKKKRMCKTEKIAFFKNVVKDCTKEKPIRSSSILCRIPINRKKVFILTVIISNLNLYLRIVLSFHTPN